MGRTRAPLPSHFLKSCVHVFACLLWSFITSDLPSAFQNKICPQKSNIKIFLTASQKIWWILRFLYFCHVLCHDYYSIHFPFLLFNIFLDTETWERKYINGRKGMGPRTKSKWRWWWKVLSQNGQMSWKDGSTGGLF